MKLINLTNKEKIYTHPFSRDHVNILPGGMIEVSEGEAIYVLEKGNGIWGAGDQEAILIRNQIRKYPYLCTKTNSTHHRKLNQYEVDRVFRCFDGRHGADCGYKCPYLRKLNGVRKSLTECNLPYGMRYSFIHEF